MFGELKQRASQRWASVKQRHPTVRHTVLAWKRMQDTNGNQYAAAITYFSFLALFPLLLLAIAVTGFVLHAHPAAQRDLFDSITRNVPGDFGKTLRTSITSAINARTSVGVVGLAGFLLTGLGWVGNLRAAVEAVWQRRNVKLGFVRAKLLNLGVLAGLGLGLVLSLGLTVAGTALTDQIVRWLSLDTVTGVHWLVRGVGVALAILGDVVIFWWLLVRLPGVRVSRRVLVRGTALAAVGFEALKIVGTYTIAHTSNSPTAGPFAGLLAVLIWIQLVARFMLFCAAWMAVVTAEAPRAPTAV